MIVSLYVDYFSLAGSDKAQIEFFDHEIIKIFNMRSARVWSKHSNYSDGEVTKG